MEHFRIQKNESIALIPARSGSKGVPGKNIRQLKGFPLIAYTIAACLLSKEIQRVIVSTDSEEIAEVAKMYGAEVPFLRPVELAGDHAKDIEFVKHAVNWLNQNENGLPEFMVHMRPTTPLREVSVVDAAIQNIKADSKATSLRSGHKASESPLKWFTKDERGYFHSLVSKMSNEDANDGRQNFLDVYIPDGYVDVIKTKFVLEQNILHGDRMIGYQSPNCQEIDEEEDFFLLEYQIEKFGSPLYQYLNLKG